MNRLTLIIFAFLVLLTGYSVYLSRLAVETNRHQAKELNELALKLSDGERGQGNLRVEENEQFLKTIEERLTKVEKNLELLKVSKKTNSAEPSRVVSALPPGPPRTDDGVSEESRPDRYRVGPGETLWGISKKLYGNPWHWHELWKANEARLPVYRRLPSGFVLVVPG